MLQLSLNTNGQSIANALNIGQAARLSRPYKSRVDPVSWRSFFLAAAMSSTDKPSADWWYTKEGVSKGPLSGEQMQRLFVSGELEATTLVWQSGMEDWKPAAQVEALKHILASGEPRAPSIEKMDRPTLTEEERTALDAIVDRVGIDDVISALRAICHERNLV